jgi:hypothetical protein
MKKDYVFPPFFAGVLTWALLPNLTCAADHAPSPPWVTSVPANAEWTISLSTPTGKSLPKGALQNIHVVKTGNTKHDTLTYNDGTTEEAWYVGKTALLTDTFSKKNIYLSNFSAADYAGLGDPVHSLGFTGFDWVNSGNYDTVVNYQGESCSHYRFQGQAEAWIRVKDKMPVAYRAGGVLYTYSFSSAPTAPLTLPPAYQAVWDQSLLIQKRQAMFQQDLGKH